MRSVVLAHGMGSSFEQNWRRNGWVELLDDAGGIAVPYELPGHGGAASVAACPDAVDRYLQLVDRVSPSMPVDAVGFSAGSVVTLGAVAARPERFRRVALLGLGDRQIEVDPALVAALVAERSPALDGIRLAADRAGNDLAEVLEFAVGAPVVSWSHLATAKVPILLVLGERDIVAPAQRLLAELPDARLEILPGVDHFSTAARLECQDVVLRFLA